MKRLTSALLFALVLVSPALADDPVAQRCGLFCKIWRNVSGKVQRPVESGAWDDGAMRVPSAAEEARIPRTDDLVVVHGDIIRKSPAERRREQAVAEAQIKRIDALRQDSGRTGEMASSLDAARLRRRDEPRGSAPSQ